MSTFQLGSAVLHFFLQTRNIYHKFKPGIYYFSAAPSTPSPSTTTTSSLPYYETDFSNNTTTTSTRYMKKNDLPPLDVLASPMPNRRLMKPNSEMRIPQSPLMRRKEYPLIEREEPPPCDRLAHMLKDSGGDDSEMGDGSKFDRFSPARKTTRRPLVRTSTKDGDLVPKEEDAKKESRLEKQEAVDEISSPVTPRPTGINRSLAEMLTKSEEPKGLRRSSSESIKRPAFLSNRTATTTTTPTLRYK